jgi:hypothetical protein
MSAPVLALRGPGDFTALLFRRIFDKLQNTAAEGDDGRRQDGWNDTTYDGFHDHTKVWSVIDSATGGCVYAR